MFSCVHEQYKQFYGDVHPSTLNALVNLATVHKDLHEYEAAIPLYEEALKHRFQLEGDSVNYVMCKAMAAGAYREVGNYEKADQYLKDAYLRLSMEFQTEDNVSCSVILNSMGMLYKKQKKFERALDAYERSLKIRETQMGEDHPDTCATRHNIAELYVEWVKPEKAQEYLERNIRLMEQRNERDKNLEPKEKKPSESSFF